MKKELILQIKYGGLGDHLFYSHLPRIAKETGGFEKVFISTQSVMPNKDFQKLIWEYNPHVDGFTEKSGVSAPLKIEVKDDFNLLDAVMLSFGLDDGKRFHEPEIYYTPKRIISLEDKTIYIPNYLSNAGLLTGRKIDNYFSKNHIHIDYQGYIREKRAVPILEFDSWLKTPNFWDFIDVVYSVKELYCLVTGTASLLPALHKKANVFYTSEMPKEFRHSRLNSYIPL